MKLLIVGDKPVKPGLKPFEQAKCWPRLERWISTLNTDNYVLINQSDFNFSQTLEDLFDAGFTVVALGNTASKAVQWFDIPHFKLPHPSSRNRQLNDPNFEQQKLKECLEWLKNQKLS